MELERRTGYSKLQEYCRQNEQFQAVRNPITGFCPDLPTSDTKALLQFILSIDAFDNFQNQVYYWY